MKNTCHMVGDQVSEWQPPSLHGGGLLMSVGEIRRKQGKWLVNDGQNHTAKQKLQNRNGIQKQTHI